MSLSLTSLATYLALRESLGAGGSIQSTELEDIAPRKVLSTGNTRGDSISSGDSNVLHGDLQPTFDPGLSVGSWLGPDIEQHCSPV